MQAKVYIEGQQLTLKSEEQISLTSSVLSIEDITVNTTDYSKEFNVPADENNNRILKHYYNANIDEGFDARTAAKGFILIDGWNFRTGSFLLRDVKIEKGVPTLYTLNFQGELLSFKNIIGETKLKDLEGLKAFNHNFNSANVQTGLTTSLFGGDMVYNLMAKKRYYYTSNAADTTQTDLTTNIGYIATGLNGVKWNDLRPSLRAIKIIEAIEAKFGLTFSRDFFGTNAFNNLFLWLNNDSVPRISGTEVKINWNSGDSSLINFSTDIGTYIIDNKPRRWYKFYTRIIPSAGYENVNYTFRQYTSIEGGAYQKTWEYTCVGIRNLETSVRSDDNRAKPFQCYWTVDSQQAFKFTADIQQARRDYWSEISRVTTYASQMSIASIFDTQMNVPDIKIIDFLKGIFNAFKLVIIPTSENEVYVNTVKGYYLQGEILDLTRYVDTKEVIVSRADIVNPIKYNFEASETILGVQFQKDNGRFYGDEEATLKDDKGEPLQGNSLEVKLPFEQVIYERLTNQQNEAVTNVQVGTITDIAGAGTNIQPHLFYSLSVGISGSPIGFINDKATKVQLNGLLNIPSHSDSFEYADNVFLFSNEFSTWNGGVMINTLYKLYHEEYIQSIFDIKSRRVKVTAHLPQRYILALSLNDAIKIKSNYYRINNFTTELQSGLTTLELFTSSTISVKSLSTQTTEIKFNNLAQFQDVAVTNLQPFTSQLIDVGQGTNWLTVESSGDNLLRFTVQANSVENRICEVLITNTLTNETLLFDVAQSVTDQAL